MKDEPCWIRMSFRVDQGTQYHQASQSNLRVYGSHVSIKFDVPHLPYLRNRPWPSLTHLCDHDMYGAVSSV